MKSYTTPAEYKSEKINFFSTSQNKLKKRDHFPHLQRVLPPSQAIERENFIHINPEKWKELISIQMDPSHPRFRDNLCNFMQLMERIRTDVQSNLGLSAIEREAHETQHPIWIMKGKPLFPLDENGEIKQENILYDSVELESLLPKYPPKVLIIKDSSNDEGLSILYKTKFRTFSLHIASDGRVISSLDLNWKTIYDDLSPESDVLDQQQALRSFTPWQRHSESNFFNGRSTNKILMNLTKTFPSTFTYDSQSYYRDAHSESLNLSKDNVDKVKTNSPNLYITLDASLIEPAKEFEVTSRQPILAVVRRQSPLLGNLIQIVPALYADGKLHLVLHGHQEETEIQEVFSCDFENEALHPWKWQENQVILKTEEVKQETSPAWKSLHLLKHSKHKELIKHTAAAPMVRASDAVMRKYWLSGFDIATVYTEMTTIADIFNICNEASHSPRDILEKFYYSDEATSSFRRLSFSEYELRQAENFAFQVAVPHESTDESFFWGKNGENIARTTRMALKVMFKMVPGEFHHKMRFAVNMCCPAASIERVGGGFGLCNKPEYIERIVQSIKEVYPTLCVEFKTLMLSNANKVVARASSNTSTVQPNVKNDAATLHKISFEKNKDMSEMLSTIGASGLVWQGKPRNEEVYSLQTVLDITKAALVNTNFKYSYSGMVATLEDSQLLKLGYKEAGSPHYSVESILENVKEMHGGELPDGFEVMLGRVLLGSSWLLLGRYATDQEILLMTFLQSFLLREFAVGAGPCGIDLMQVQILYNVRHLDDDSLRNNLMSNIFEARSATQMIDALYEGYTSLNQEKDIDEVSLLKPSIVKLKTAIESATSGGFNLFSDREKMLSGNQLVKAAALKP
jgi:hypothetical protein